MFRSLAHACLCALFVISAVSAQGGSPVSHAIDSVPDGYYLYFYDDCGIEGRQPHVQMADSYLWTFNTSDTDADLKSRSAVFSYKQVNAVYEDLNPKLDYVLAVTYANDHVYNRVQSLHADGVELHGPYTLPKARAVRLILRVPAEVTRDGRMSLELKIHGEVNATVSIIELWATAPPPVSFQISGVSGVFSTLTGRALDLAYEGLAGAEVRLGRVGSRDALAITRTRPDGEFAFDRKLVEGLGPGSELQITAAHEGQEVSKTVPAENLFFDPVRYRPIPAKTAGLRRNQMLLDGAWRINPDPPEDARSERLNAAGWGDLKVPGQWLQQGYEIPQDKPAAVAREFVIPKEWAGCRIFLQFDSIHAGTHYWLNGRPLGHSENLFTPVEWEITDAAKPGETNRLDLRMTVNTISEALSYSCGYAFHSLGGIDRSVRLYALPRVQIRDLHLDTDLDAQYRDADLRLRLTLDNPASEPQSDLSLHISLYDGGGKPVKLSHSNVRLDCPERSEKAVEVTTHVPNPLKWNAEQPNLYRLVLELKKGGELLERIERSIGFRRVEIKDSQLYVNGRRVKLAGACRHEIDPLTGRADTMRHAEEDIKLLKGANLNYVRTAHYPPTQELLDAADRLGVYVEVEAPFCWVGPSDDLSNVKEVLRPTSAMIDYCHTHPSVIIWSLANESHFNEVFEVSNQLAKELDPSRPTTFNNPDPKQVCDIANLHYPPMPYDEQIRDDPWPILLGEYFFPVCHEQTDVNINPGLRELWGAGHSDPDSDWAKACAASFDVPALKPGAKPGVWTHIYDSDRVIGGAIWALIDEPFYFAGGKHCGYAWVHGFWGLIDGWRRPKPEWWLSKLIFSPVWFPARHVDFSPGQTSIRVPVENRYSFTDLSDLTFAWETGKHKGRVKASLPPGSKGEMEIPIPAGTAEGERVILRVTDSAGKLVNAVAVRLGKEKASPLPQPTAGAPEWHDDGGIVTIEGNGFSLVLDRATGDFDAGSQNHKAAVMKFPALHVTRYDFGDLAGPNSPPYAEFPDAGTRAVESITIEERAEGLEVTVRDRYENFAGSVSWLIDRNGIGRVSYDYTYSGADMNTREVGLKFLLKPECDEVKWRRWSEWGIYPEDSISRTEGIAKARRDAKWGEERWDRKPEWPWSLDQTELGTSDFRSAKFNIYEASLAASDGSGLSVHANADVHVRPALSEHGVRLHVLSQCRLGQFLLQTGDRLKGEFVVGLLPEMSPLGRGTSPGVLESQE